MPVERAAGGTSLVDVLDRVLDKGIVIDAWVRVSLVGIDLITVEARVVVASIDTYLKYAEAVGQVSTASRPVLEATGPRLAARGPCSSGSACRVRGRTRAPRRSARRPHDQPEAKLALTELLLSSVDASDCAQTGLEWLGRHVTSGRALLATAASDPGPPVGHCGARHFDGAHRRVRARSRRSARSARRRRLERQAGAIPRRPAAAGNPARKRALPRGAAASRSSAAAARPAAARERRAGCRRRHPLVRGDPRREVPVAAAAQRHRRSRRRPRAAPALQHHQLGHRPDPADRRIRAS